MPVTIAGEAAALQALPDSCRLQLVFGDEFTSQSIAARELGIARWTAHTPWSGDFGDAVFSDPGADGPFSVVDGMLRITASKGGGDKWHSGLIAAADASGRGQGLQYGYYETRVKLPRGPGTWPSFWLSTLRPAGTKGPSVEIDVFEYYGHDSGSFQSAVHVWTEDPHLGKHETHKTEVPDHSLTDQFHTFGVWTQPSMIIFYLDGRAFWEFPTPEQLILPLFPMVDLALGSGFPIDKTPDPSTLFVDYVHMYRVASQGESCPKKRGG